MKITLISILILLFCSCTAPSKDVVLQSIKIDPNTANMQVGEGLQLNFQFTPDVFKTIPVVWSTSNPQVATVNSTGSVEALSPGQAIITIKDQHSATSGECHIIVTQ